MVTYPNECPARARGEISVERKKSVAELSRQSAKLYLGCLVRIPRNRCVKVLFAPRGLLRGYLEILGKRIHDR